VLADAYHQRFQPGNERVLETGKPVKLLKQVGDQIYNFSALKFDHGCCGSYLG